jgi:hypothetical protein
MVPLLDLLPVWLAGDPLVGISTATGFFVFLMLGRAIKVRQLRRKRELR